MSEPKIPDLDETARPSSVAEVPETPLDFVETLHTALRCCGLSADVDEIGSAGEHSPIVSVAALLERAPLVKNSFVAMVHLLRLKDGAETYSAINAGPVIPDDWLPRLAVRYGKPDTLETPADLYTHEEVRGWLSRTSVPVAQYARMYIHNLSRQIAGAVKGRLRETTIHTFLTPLYYICHYGGWKSCLEYIDNLWSDGWFLSLEAVSRLRTDVWQCSLKGGSGEHLSYKEFSEALDSVTLKPDTPSSWLIASDQIEEFVSQIRSRVAQCRSESSDLESWLRGLHGAALLTNSALSMLMAQRRMMASQPQQQERLLRIVAELDCDIKEVIRDPFYLLPQSMTHAVVSQPSKLHAKRALRYLVRGRISVPDVIATRLEDIINASGEWPPASGHSINRELRGLMTQDVSRATRVAYELYHGKNRDQCIDEAMTRYQEFENSPRYLALPEPARAVASFLGMSRVLNLVSPRIPSISYNLGLSTRRDVEAVVATDERGRSCIMTLIYKSDICAAEGHSVLLADARSTIEAVRLASPFLLEASALKLLLIRSHVHDVMIWLVLNEASVANVVAISVAGDDTKRNESLASLGNLLQSALGGVFHLINKESDVNQINLSQDDRENE